MGRKKKYCIEGLNENEAVLLNRPLVFNLVRKYNGKINGRQYDYDDLVSAGMYGLLKAVRTYKSEKAAFSTYAHRCIRNNIFNELRRQGNMLMNGHTNWEFDTIPREETKDLEILEGLTEEEKFIAIDYYIYSQPASKIKQHLDISQKEFKQLLASIESKIIETIQQ